MKHYIVEPAAEKLRLDTFLVTKTGQTRNRLQKAIKNGLVLVNEKPAKVHQFLITKDKITLLDAPQVKPLPKTIPDDTQSRSTPKTPPPTVLHAETDFLIVEKPAGLLVHPTAKGESDTLIHRLIKKYPTLKKISDPEELKRRSPLFRPAIIHRLDRDVSGLLIVPRNQNAFDYYKNLFQKRTIKKTYLALVHGRPPSENGEAKFEISRAASGRRMAAHPENSGKGRPARTEFTTLKNYRTYTLLAVQPLTGRTNQIRAHLQALGCPLVGDRIYSKTSQYAKLPLNRVFLHAATIEFTDREGKRRNFTSELPSELNELLMTLK